MSSQAPDEPITAGLERLAAMRRAQQRIAAELAAERDAAEAKRGATVPAEEPTPEQERG